MQINKCLDNYQECHARPRTVVIALCAVLSTSVLMPFPAQALLPAAGTPPQVEANAAAHASQATLQPASQQWIPPRDLVEFTKSGDCKSDSYASEIGCLQERIAIEKARVELKKLEAEKRKTETDEMLDVLSGSDAPPNAAASNQRSASVAPAASPQSPGSNDVTVNRIVGFDDDMLAIITYNSNRMNVRAGDVIDRRLSITAIRGGAVHLVLDGVAHVMGAGVNVSANPMMPGIMPAIPGLIQPAQGF